MSAILTWEGTGEVPNFCPNGCGGISEDPYGGPCKACWDLVGRCNWCDRNGEMQSIGGRLFCGEDCAEAYREEWGDDG